MDESLAVSAKHLIPSAPLKTRTGYAYHLEIYEYIVGNEKTKSKLRNILEGE